MHWSSGASTALKIAKDNWVLRFRLSVATDVNNSNTNAMEIPGHRMHQVRKENQSRRFLNRFLILTLGIANVGSEVVRAFLHAGSQAEMEIKQKQWVQSLTPGTPVFYRNNTRIMVDTVIEKITVGEQTGNPLVLSYLAGESQHI